MMREEEPMQDLTKLAFEKKLIEAGFRITAEAKEIVADAEFGLRHFRLLVVGEDKHGRLLYKKIGYWLDDDGLVVKPGHVIPDGEFGEAKSLGLFTSASGALKVDAAVAMVRAIPGVIAIERFEASGDRVLVAAIEMDGAVAKPAQYIVYEGTGGAPQVARLELRAAIAQ